MDNYTATITISSLQLINAGFWLGLGFTIVKSLSGLLDAVINYGEARWKLYRAKRAHAKAVKEAVV
jgi:hypothetical protein